MDTTTSPTDQPNQDKIRVQREWVGAHPGTVTNPTVWICIATILLLGGTAAAYLAGAIPVALAIPLNTLAIYLSFTVMHEAMHGVAHNNRTVNTWLGRLMGPLLTITYPMFRAIHYEHHSHTNDPDRDPDHYLARVPVWLLPVAALAITFEYRRQYFSRGLWKNDNELREALVTEAFVVGAICAAAVTGNFTTLAVLWLVPGLLAAMLLALVFDYLPHYPYDSRERFHDTRVYPGRVGFMLTLGQNYHLIHHLWTTVPWYRYPTVFREILPQLEARNVRIGLRVNPGNPSTELSGSLVPH